MFQFNPSSRLSMAECLSHPWVTNPNVATRQEVKEYFDKVKALVEAKAEE
jgi:hypothetical protein